MTPDTHGDDTDQAADEALAILREHGPLKKDEAVAALRELYQDGEISFDTQWRLTAEYGRAYAIPGEFPEIVCLCGSTRFDEAFKEAQFRLTVEGKIVLTVAGNWKDDHDDVWDEIDDEQKEALDELHFRKIDLADRVLVLNVDGYIGSSTRNEIQHAVETGTGVSWLEPENVPEEFARYSTDIDA